MIILPMKLMIAVMRNSNRPIAIRELSFRPSASPNWLAMTLAIVLPVEVKDVGRILVLPISIVTAIVSPNALLSQDITGEYSGTCDRENHRRITSRRVPPKL